MAYYGLGTKTAILQDIYNKVSTISKANGYNNDISLVDWQRLVASANRDDYPGCFINDVRLEKTKLLKDLYKNLFIVELVGFVWDETGNLETTLNSFIEDVAKAMMSDPTRNNNAFDTVITAVDTDVGTYNPQGAFLMILRIIFFSEE